MSGHFRTVFMAVLMLFVFAAGSLMLPEGAQAQPNKKTSTKCSQCHNGALSGTQATYASVNGVEGTSFSLPPSSTFEIDWIFTGMRGYTPTRGVVPYMGLPAGWTPALTTNTANPTTINGVTWSTFWDNPFTKGATPSDTPTWQASGAEDGTGPEGFTSANVYKGLFEGSSWEDGSGSVIDDGTAGDLDGTIDVMGADARFTLPASGGPWTIYVGGVGHGASAKAITTVAVTISLTGGADVTAPNVVADLATGAVTTSTIALSWTAPGDDGAVGTATTYDVRYSTAGAINDGNWAFATLATGEPAPSIAGTTENFTVTGLNPSQQYWFAIRTSDEVPNTALTSNSPTATTSAAADVTAPDVVADLATGAVTTSTIALSWTAPGDDGAVGTATTYDVRYSTAGAINDGNWAAATPAPGEPAPSIAGTTENFTVTGLSASQQYWFAIRTSDEVPNTALTSNSPTATTSAACAPAQPTVSIAPASQTIPNDGGLVVYTVTITNNDSVTCGNTTFNLSVNDTNGTEFYTSILDKSDTGSLASNGGFTTASLTVQALPGYDGVSDDTTVTATDSPTHDPPVVSAAVTTTVTLGGGCVGTGNNPNASAGGTFITGR